MTGSRFLTTTEVAALLRVHPKHVFRLLKQGLPGRRGGAKWLFDRDEVLAWAAARGTAEREPTPVPGPPGASRPTGDSVVPLVAANGDLLIELLLTAVREGGSPPVGLVQSDRALARRLLDQRTVMAAGHHGDVPVERRLTWIHLAHREIGLCTRGRKLASLRSLGTSRLVSRPPTAGVRAHLDAVLLDAGLAPDELHQRALLAASHRDVVCAVARGDGDVGLATRAWASHLGLAFYEIASEPYGLLVTTQDLGASPLASLCAMAQSRAYRQQLKALPGYDPRQAGEIRVSP